ncbi:hypothetical protein RRF57_009663 [Xylaria bambusicola]|uniref:Uncharacterized protein n=1 Tax=Xylaria bambusicola TaxID=326684 RepID=A0AAN7V2V5_9PEZI
MINSAQDHRSDRASSSSLRKIDKGSTERGELDSAGHLNSGSKLLSRSVDQSTSASTLNITAPKVGAGSRLPKHGPASIEDASQNSGDLYPRSARGALGGAVLGHEEERGEVVAQSLNS